MYVNSRVKACAVALETTLLLHGVPKGEGKPLADELAAIVSREGGSPTLIGIVDGVPTVGLTDEELGKLLDAPKVPKVNTANLGLILHRKSHGATTVSTTMELAAAAGVRFFATGGLGGVHHGYGTRFDISADLAAFTRFPVAVVTAGVKSLLDVAATRECLETLGIPVVGFKTKKFPAFYLRESESGVDETFDDAAELARYCRDEVKRTGRGIVVCNPIPEADEIRRSDWDRWLEQAMAEGIPEGRDVTPAILGRLHALSGGATLRANLALVRSNAALAGRLAALSM